MNELFSDLAPGSVVLDLGCGVCSFDSAGMQFTAVRLDVEPKSARISNFVQADAARLPFGAGCFDLVVSNHSLEHVENLASALEEIARVLKSTVFRSSIARPTDTPIYASRETSRRRPQDSGPRWSRFLLSRRALSSPTTCRFYPGAPRQIRQ